LVVFSVVVTVPLSVELVSVITVGVSTTGSGSTTGIEGLGGRVLIDGVTVTASEPGAVVVLVKLMGRIACGI
jgi:hypothetical protein